MDTKKHFKMYKSGKLWVSAAVVTATLTAGMAFGGQSVKADTPANGAATTLQANKGTHQQVMIVQPTAQHQLIMPLQMN